MSSDTPADQESFDDPDVVTRDVEETFIAALQESDTAVETIQDAGATPHAAWWRRHRRVGVMGMLLALVGLMVARRRS